MKHCRNIQEQLSAFLDNELPPSERDNVQAHLDACAGCQSRFKELRRLVSGVEAFPRLPVTQKFVEDLEQRIRLERIAAMRPTWVDRLFRPAWLKLPIEGLTIAAVVLIAMMLGQPTPLKRQSPPSRIAQKKVMENETAADARFDDQSAVVAMEQIGPKTPAATAPSVSPANSSFKSEATPRQQNVRAVITGNFDELRRQAQSIAAGYSGRVIEMPETKNREAARESRASIWVELPVSAVGVFTQQLAQVALRKETTAENDVLSAGGSFGRRADAKTAPVILEIQVVAP